MVTSAGKGPIAQHTDFKNLIESEDVRATCFVENQLDDWTIQTKTRDDNNENIFLSLNDRTKLSYYQYCRSGDGSSHRLQLEQSRRVGLRVWKDLSFTMDTAAMMDLKTKMINKIIDIYFPLGLNVDSGKRFIHIWGNVPWGNISSLSDSESLQIIIIILKKINQNKHLLHWIYGEIQLELGARPVFWEACSWVKYHKRIWQRSVLDKTWGWHPETNEATNYWTKLDKDDDNLDGLFVTNIFVAGS